MPEYRTFFEKLARDRNITVDEMRAIISARIEAGINDPDPTRRAQWEKIPHAGVTPTGGMAELCGRETGIGRTIRPAPLVPQPLKTNSVEGRFFWRPSRCLYRV